MIGIDFFFPGKSVGLCSTKALQSFAMSNLFPIRRYDSVRRCEGIIQEGMDKNDRIET